MGRKGMLTMNQIDEVKELQNQGYGPVEISRRLGINRKTVSAYMQKESFSAGFPERAERSSKLDRWKKEIDLWLDEDRRMRYKQRHTAKRVFKRLTELHPDFGCSYSIVQRYLKTAKKSRIASDGALELVWESGVAQADFGEADILENEKKKCLKYFVLSFPFSNAAYTQGFGGETAECVCQGLLDIFNHVGGVPLRIVFDNATGVGRRVRDQVMYSELFLRFKCHYGFSVTFCNPESGQEKGNVESKVGYIRRNMFVPIPEVTDLVSWNKELLSTCERDFERQHYKKGQLIAELFKQDQAALAPLPSKPFRVERLVKYRTDGYGKFCTDSNHWYSTRPENAYANIIAGIGAHTITAYTEAGEVISCQARIYGSSRTDSTDYATTIDMLVKKSGAWKNCELRNKLDGESRSLIDEMTKPKRGELLRSLGKNAEQYGFDIALSSLEEAVKRGTDDEFSIQALAARRAYDLFGELPDSGPNLGLYDSALLRGEGSPK
jgi:transposase